MRWSPHQLQVRPLGAGDGKEAGGQLWAAGWEHLNTGTCRQLKGKLKSSLLHVQFIEEKSRPFPTRCEAGLRLSEGCPQEIPGDDSWVTLMHVFATQTCQRIWSCHCRAVIREHGCRSSGTGILLHFVFSIGGSHC